MKKTSKYRDIATQLKMSITSKEYDVGSTIPSQVQLGDMFNVSQITVRKAVDMLEQEGYIRKGNGRGNGSIVLARAEEHVRRRIGYNFGVIGRPRVLDKHSHDLPVVAEGMIEELTKWDAVLSVLPFLTDEYPHGMSFVHSVIEKNLVDGFFIFELYDADELCNFFAASNIPFVRVMTFCTGLEQMESSNFPLVAIEEREQLKTMIGKAKADGLDRVVLLGGGDDFVEGRTNDLLMAPAQECGMEYKAVNASEMDFESLCGVIQQCSESNTLTITSTFLLHKLDMALSIMPKDITNKINLVVYKHYGGEIDDLIGNYAMIERPFRQLGFEAAKMMKGLIELKAEGKPFCNSQHVILHQYLNTK